MNLFCIIINSEVYYFIDQLNVQKNPVLNEYISSYQLADTTDNEMLFSQLLHDIKDTLKIELHPIKLIDVYRPNSDG